MIKSLTLIALFFAGNAAATEFPNFLVADIEWNSDGERSADDLAPVLAFIPGEIFGNPKTGLGVIRLTPLGDKSMSFPLSLILEKTEEASTELTTSARKAGISITPSQTKLLRVGTFFGRPGLKTLYGGGFVVEGSRSSLVLIFVDRPCSITGTISFPEGDYVHDLQFSEPGFHFIQATDDGRLVNIDAPERILYKGGSG